MANELDTRVTRATLAAQVESAVRADIITGALEPGRRLRAADLIQRYGVSATPLREALQRLAAQKLIELGPRFGATVAPVSRPELADLYWLRGLLDPMALERSIRNGDSAWEERVTRAYEAFERANAADGATPDSDEWTVAHRTFHDVLFSACDSPWLRRFVEVLSDHSERYRRLSHRSLTRRSGAEHRRLYNAAIARDVDAATAALRRHLAATVELLERTMDSPGDGTSGSTA